MVCEGASSFLNKNTSTPPALSLPVSLWRVPVQLTHTQRPEYSFPATCQSQNSRPERHAELSREFGLWKRAWEWGCWWVSHTLNTYSPNTYVLFPLKHLLEPDAFPRHHFSVLPPQCPLYLLPLPLPPLQSHCPLCQDLVSLDHGKLSTAFSRCPLHRGRTSLLVGWLHLISPTSFPSILSRHFALASGLCHAVDSRAALGPQFLMSARPHLLLFIFNPSCPPPAS